MGVPGEFSAALMTALFVYYYYYGDDGDKVSDKNL